MKLRKTLTTLALAAALLSAMAAPAWAGSPHFVDSTVTASRTGDVLTVSGKEAGLGDELQVHVVASAEVACLNPGEQFPQAGNKQTVSAVGDFPVQHGSTTFSLDLVPVLQPPCSPPMRLVFGDVTVTDTTNGITTSVSGTF
jgi:hypothetical protein